MSKPVLSLTGRALRFLSRREYSRQELRKKLLPYAQEEGELDAVLDKLEQQKFLHARLLEQYRQKNWQECQGLLETLIGLWNGEIDTFYRELESRVQEYITSPPPDTWDGSLIKTVQ